MFWKCSVCNFIWEGDAPPEKCPKCGAPAEKYEEMTEESWKTAERARFTNALHIELLDILPRLMEIAQEGIEDNLDPRCLTVFNRLQSEASFLEASIKAELEGHVKKGKWG
jgi:rubredoxin